MADLDDFFAKKDKKKSKKPKFLTAEELVKNLEETKREIAKAKKISEPIQPATPNVDVVEEIPKEQVFTSLQVEDEWKEVEEEQRKDYTGLKIGQLNLSDEDDESDSEVQEEDGDSDGNQSNDMSKHSDGGPWKKVIPAEEVTQIPMEMPKPVSKVYVTPALRAQQALGSSLKTKPRNKAAPDITNADFFPTLGAARPEEQRKKKNEPAFEEVRHGGRVQKVKEQIVGPSAATNRFQSLDETES